MSSLDYYREATDADANAKYRARAVDHWNHDQRQCFTRVMAQYGHTAEYNLLTRQWTIDGVKMYGAAEVYAAYQTARQQFYAAEHGLEQFAEELAAL